MTKDYFSRPVSQLTREELEHELSAAVTASMVRLLVERLS